MTGLPTRRALLATVVGAGAAVALSGCSREETPHTDEGHQAPSPDDSGSISHIHAIAFEPSSGAVLLATHTGLFRIDGRERVLLSPVMDLMGFAVAPDGTYLASGHPGGDDLPQPLGLVESRDGGRTWIVRSRGGQSDFHALTAGPRHVTGFDGTLRVTSDRATWSEAPIAAPPLTLSASPRDGSVVATTEAGLLLTRDAGQSWSTLPTPSLVSHAAWADGTTIVAASIEGVLMSSADAGRTWRSGSAMAEGPVEALAAHRARGQLEVLVAVGDRVLRTSDLGATSSAAL